LPGTPYRIPLADHGPRYPVTQFDMVAEQIVHYEIGVEAA
jgi:hypothetical protein